ncbi:MAG: hypothetical protein BSOLF_0201 [Candidatus Carbobacillus altaicus]|uniref:Uncharacterized protein n=1 Tax=Candidatus Carbonibacillus altaicus TaxID=2163959 RepID=A0A2R6XXG8_9BACL|nr:MAG: hypothetical protein BSOLF_0201 [Candidatus Carbobacillus altaicus]
MQTSPQYWEGRPSREHTGWNARAQDPDFRKEVTAWFGGVPA